MVSSYGVGIMGSSTEWSRAQESGYEKFQNEFGTSIMQTSINNVCKSNV
jgi:hypothetical protein